MALRPWHSLLLVLCTPLSVLSGCGSSSGSGQPGKGTQTPATATSSGSAAASVDTPASPANPGDKAGNRPDAPPAAPSRPVTDAYHGVSVVDPYQWLENWNDPEVQAWSNAQNRHARHILDSLPGLDAIRGRLTEILTAPVVSYGGLKVNGKTVFAIKREPPKQQPFLVVMDSLQPDTARALVDPNQLDPSGATTIDWFVPSPDGKLVAVSLSRGGTERGDVSIYEVATGKQVHEVIPHVNGGTAGGDLAWAADGKGFFYTRYPRGDERPAEDQDFYQQVYFHALGTPTEQDRYELGQDFPRIAEIQLTLDARTGRILATVQNGDGGEFAHYLRAGAAKGTWRQLSRFEDRIVQATFGPKNDLYAVSRKDAPRGKILHAPITGQNAVDFQRAKVVVPEGQEAIITDFWSPPTVLATKSRLYVLYQLGGPSELRVFDLRGKRTTAPEQLPVSSVYNLTPMGAGDDIVYLNTSYVEPSAWYRFDAQAGTTQKTALAVQSPVSFANVEVVRELATSRDGTRVPLNILMPRGTKLDGKNPAVVTGYGGFRVSLQPGFNPAQAVFLEQGVIYVIANLRGGSEFGDTWNEQGRLTAKQNVFDDFAAVLQHLIDRGYTSPERIGIIGGSNGGLLMGATMVQHPELVKAVVAQVGIYDSLRSELSKNGQFNVAEYGTVKDPEQFKALHAYSPYHNVREGVRYPAALFTTGANDPRVEPWHSRKMVARLQAATSSDAPILLRTSANTGHGGGTALNEYIEQLAHVDAFLFHQLGVRYQAPAAR